MKDQQLKISVLTPTYNMGEFIEDNIKSVLNQNYENWEHIIYDAVSTDNTLEILKKYEHLLWTSEPDSGQSDAYNKALQKASGDLVLCLNADDYLLEKDVFSKVIDEVSKCRLEDYSAFMGNIFIVKRDGSIISEMNNRNRDYSFHDLLNITPLVIHPATFFRTNLLKEIGGFDLNVHYQMDYEIFLRCAKNKPIHSIDVLVSALRRHETSKGMGDQNWRFSLEFLKIRKKYGGNFFNKMNVQPIKVLIYKFVIGYRVVNWAKKNKTATAIAKAIGITKFDKLEWYEKSKT